MRVALIADSHFDEHSRFEECIRLHDWIAEECRCREVDLVLHAGDLYERKSTPRERLAAADWLRQVAEHCTVVLVRGNHDAVDDLPLLGKLDTEYPVHIVDRPYVVLHRFGTAVASVACLPWPTKANILAQLDASTGHEAGELVAREALRNVLRGLGAQMAQYDGPKLFLGHVMMRGSKTSTGQELVGCDLELGLDDLALVGADFYGLGHIHMHQRWATPDAPVFYPGSPRRCNFGEAEPKGFIVADLVDDEVQWSFVETPARRMVTLDYSFDGELHPVGSTVLEVLSHVSDTEFRLRYRVPADQRDAAKTAVEKERQLLLENGAHSVKVEPQIIATTRARAPEVATAQTLTEKLEALWAARNDVPEPERGERLLGKARTLEESHAV